MTLPLHRPVRFGAMLALAMATAVTAACAGGSAATQAGSSASTGPYTITLYTSVTQNTVNAVVGGFKQAHPGANVSVYRATTGDLNARIAADRRTGGVRADVIWGTDPLSMDTYAKDGLLKTHPIALPSGVPAQYSTAQLIPTRLLYLVLVVHKGFTPVPTSWADLTQPAYAGKVAIPDPAAAGSAFAALGYFDQAPGYGLAYYSKLKANGAVQVSTIPEVVTDVADGRYQVGITLDSQVRGAIAAGSPVRMVWPSPGAIALYSPIAVTGDSKNGAADSAFLDYVLSEKGQREIAATGWQPVLSGVPGPPIPTGGHEVWPDWNSLFGRQQQLLSRYQAIFGV
jgi:iron(III) transport system substrate-binding protein